MFGSGFGGRVLLEFAIAHPELSQGLVCGDYAPYNYAKDSNLKYYSETVEQLEKLRSIDLSKEYSEVEAQIKSVFPSKYEN